MTSRWKLDKNLLKRTKDGFPDFARKLKIRNPNGAKPKLGNAERAGNHRYEMSEIKKGKSTDSKSRLGRKT